MRSFLEGGSTCVFQWDNKRRLILDGYPEGVVVAYSNECSEKAPIVESYSENGVVYANIPPEIMQEPYSIEADIRQDGNTLHKTFITLVPGNKPDDYVAEPVEILRYETLAKRIPFDASYEGHLLYVSGGVALPLKLGPGLSIRDGVLYVSGGTDEPETPVGVVTAEVDADGAFRVYLDGEEVVPVVDDAGDMTWPGLEIVVDEAGDATLKVKEV